MHRSKPGTQCIQYSLHPMTQATTLQDLIGPARSAPYLTATHGDPKLAAALYAWGVELAGAWHSHISYVEVAVRNAIDVQLKQWNGQHGGGPEWTAPGKAGSLLHKIIGSAIADARVSAKKEAARRPTGHPRYGHHPTHDDVVAQLMFGAWSRLLMLPHHDPHVRQKKLWSQGLCSAFPQGHSTDSGRETAGRQLESLRLLRNRIAHHDNLLRVNTIGHLNSSLSLLSKIDSSYPSLVMSRNSLRRLVQEDPRRF